MSNLYNHAKRELYLMYPDGADEMEQEIIDSILSIVKTFSKVGHSGSSADWTLNVIHKLLGFENLTAITVNQAEWEDVSDMAADAGNELWQNKRNPAIFSNDGGKTHYHVDKPKILINSINTKEE